MSARNQKSSPQMADYPQMETGWNQYGNDYIARRGLTALLWHLEMEVMRQGDEPL